jgi:UDPglucose--hexose-1-phosphate uridylyltransferase
VTCNEMRKDYLLDRWVVIATSRCRRPTDFVKPKQQTTKSGTCPMCPGNEHMTPPATLLYLRADTKILKTKDVDESRKKNWLVRVVPNLFPAYTPPEGLKSSKRINASSAIPAIGHHEVLIESPNHDEDPADASLSQLTLVVRAYIDRLRELSAKPYVRYVSIFRNHGLEAGASLSHAHSQLIATPLVPKIVKDELDAAKKFHKENGKCIFCDIIDKERKGPRLMLENSKFVAFTPYASVNPMEFWVFPRKHETSLLSMQKSEIEVFAQTLKECLGRLKSLVSDPPYNYGIHLSMDENTGKYYHWHLEVYPRLAIWAGFEKSTGVYINTITPEAAAESLRKPVSN